MLSILKKAVRKLTGPRYKVPCGRLETGEEREGTFYVNFSIDWESCRNEKEIEKRALGFLNYLDKINIPSTWFLEVHGENPDVDITRKHPELARRIVRSHNSEIGTHIHWSKKRNGDSVYPVWDTKWIEEMVRIGTEIIEKQTGVRPKCFRGGAFLKVPNLISILEKYNYLVDSSVIDRRPLVERITAAKKKVYPNPYVPDRRDCWCEGGSRMLEMPVHFYLFSKRYAFCRWMLLKIITRSCHNLSGGKDVFFNIFVHSCDLLAPRRISLIKQYLHYLKSLERVKFIKMQEAIHYFSRVGV